MEEGGYSKLQRSVECLFEGAMVLGTDKLLKWGKGDDFPIAPNTKYRKTLPK